MAWTHSAIKTRISALLQDPSASIFKTATDGEMELEIIDSGFEIARWVPFIDSVPDVFQIESRTGSVTSDTSGALVDGTNAQFLSTDVGKVVFNATDKTWGIVTAFVSTSQLTLNKDLFPDGDEVYRIYNKGCVSTNQINIEDITDRYEIKDGDRIEHPIGTRRNIADVEGDILTIGVDTSVLENSSQVDSASPNVDVHVYFRKRHFISVMTDLSGIVDLTAGYSAGDTSMVIDNLTDGDIIKAGQLFTIASTRGTYRVTTDVTVASSEATISFYPGLENDVDNDVVVTFKQSTLTPILEPLFARYVAAKLAINKPGVIIPESRAKARPHLTDGSFTINESNKGGPGTSSDYLQYARAEIGLAEQMRLYSQLGEREMVKVVDELSRLAISRANEIFPRT
ncbi:hypothetical protein LCGC14_0907380 [marine sediment metagenome]|uniref:Uncharacterized protein n=1 Tax=marine sediment metagenome TaxID=412755 RepID=A0A0F9NUL9_9ZZZZ